MKIFEFAADKFWFYVNIFHYTTIGVLHYFLPWPVEPADLLLYFSLLRAELSEFIMDISPSHWTIKILRIPNKRVCCLSRTRTSRLDRSAVGLCESDGWFTKASLSEGLGVVGTALWTTPEISHLPATLTRICPPECFWPHRPPYIPNTLFS